MICVCKSVAAVIFADAVLFVVCVVVGDVSVCVGSVVGDADVLIICCWIV